MSDQAPRLAETPRELRDLWASSFQRRDSGGWWALSGFSIQMTVALERFVRAIADEGDRTSTAEVERLSDILLEGSNRLELTQVKRTLGASTLNSALAEAYDIGSLCSPNLLNRIDFQIVCESADEGLNVATAAPTAKEGKVYDPELLRRVRSRFVKDEPIRIMTHPKLALRRSLMDAGVDDPEAVALRALGELFNAFDGRRREGVQEALFGVVKIFREAADRKRPSAGRLLDRKELTPSPREADQLVSTYRPRVYDLLSGRFLERPRRLAAARADALAWLGGLEKSFSTADDLLPVLWLDGRPGDGKSVLALQLLQSLVLADRLGSVVELAGPEELEAWLNTAPGWATRGDEFEQAEIAFIDDLPAHLGAEAMGELVGRSFYRRPPYAGLITCGPSDALAAFKKPASRLKLTPAHVARPDLAEFQAFGAWLAGRRNVAYDPRAAIPGETLASFVYRHAASKSEAERAETIRRALQMAGSYEQVRAALAINALSQDAPRELVTVDALSAFSRSDDDIELVPELTQDGLRLGHAEVVWPIYLDWTRADGAVIAERWGGDIGVAIAGQLKAGRSVAARTTLGSLLDLKLIRRHLGAAAGESTQVTVLDAAFRAVDRACDLTQQAAVLRLFLAAESRGKLGALSQSDLRDRARKALGARAIAEGEKADIAVALLTTGPKTEDAAGSSASKYIDNAEPSPPVLGFMAQVATRGPTATDGPLLVRWLRSHQTRLTIAKILAQAIRSAISPECRELGYAFVDRFRDEPETGAVLWALSQAGKHPRFYRVLDRWLQTAPDPDVAAQLYRLQLRPATRDNYATRALAWAEANLGAKGVHEVLKGLIPVSDGEQRFERTVEAWLTANQGSPQAPPLLAALVLNDRGSRSWLPEALGYLDRHVGAPGSSLVFSTTAEVVQSMPPTARALLESASSRGEAAVLRRLLNWRRR